MTIDSAPNGSGLEFGHCEGFDVFSPDGRVGVVERLRLEHPDGGQVRTVLVVRVSLFGGRTVNVGLGDVTEIESIGIGSRSAAHRIWRRIARLPA